MGANTCFVKKGGGGINILTKNLNDVKQAEISSVRWFIRSPPVIQIQRKIPKLINEIPNILILRSDIFGTLKYRFS